MNRVWRPRESTERQWLGLCLALLLALAPPFNLAGVDIALQAQAEAGAHHAHAYDGQHHAGPDHSGHDDYGQGDSGKGHAGLAHHGSGTDCLQCLVLGGMSLPGAAAAPEPSPSLHATGAGWTCRTRIWDSRGAKILVCRGPPALA